MLIAFASLAMPFQFYPEAKLRLGNCIELLRYALMSLIYSSGSQPGATRH